MEVEPFSMLALPTIASARAPLGWLQMSPTLKFKRLRWTFAALAFSSAVLAAAPAAGRTGSDFIDPQEIARGVVISQAQCAALPSAVWVRALGRNFCIRYYLSTAGGQGNRPIVFMQGDKAWAWDGRARAFVVPPNTGPIDVANFIRLADSISRSTGTTAIYLARMGTDGSSGHHRDRHSILELEVTNAALDAIRRRHGFEGFHLVGQSGGATLIGGLLALRTDIACAVPGAGRLALLQEPRPPTDPARRIFNAVDGVPWIVRHSIARILIVSDPADARVPIRHQSLFVERLRAAGGRVEHYLVEATDPYRHATVPYTVAVVAMCIRGLPQTQIAGELANLVAMRLAARAMAQAMQQGQPAAAPRPTPQPRRQDNPPAAQ